MPHLRDITSYVLQLDALGVPRSPDVHRAIEYGERINTELRTVPRLDGRLVDLNDDGLARRFEQIVSRHDDRATSQAIVSLTNALAAEATEAMREHAPTIIEALRPTFDKAAKVLATVAAAGIRPGMTAQDAIDLNRPDAIEGWRNLNQPSTTLAHIAALRVTLSEDYGVAPGITQQQRIIGETVDYTACFTDPKTNVTTGYGVGNPAHRWLSLAIATNGKLRLNLPEETQRILHGNGESPGWLVCAAAAIVYGDGDQKREPLHLYKNNWIPTWVDQEQIDHLLDQGSIVAAPPGLERPADNYPLGDHTIDQRQAMAQ